MSPAPSLPADLHYADGEKVQLDLDAIIAQGGRIRRRRLIAKVAAVAVVCAIAPTVIVTDMARQLPGPRSLVAGTEAGYHRGADARKDVNTYPPGVNAGNNMPSVPGAGGTFGLEKGPVNGPYDGYDSAGFKMAAVENRLSAMVSPKLGTVLAMASARSAQGVWFAAASDRLTLFHLSDQGRLKSVTLTTTGSGPHAPAGVGLAVSSSNVVWIRVSAALIRYDPRSAVITSWQVPALYAGQPARQPQGAYSVAVAPDGNVAVATPGSSGVQVLDPVSGTFSLYQLPDAADRALAVGYARDSTLGIGYQHGPHQSQVMLVRPSGARLTATVAQSSAITSYGQSGFLVGTGLPDVVSGTGTVRPLKLPAGARTRAPDASPPVPLPGDRLGMALGTGILTFPAHAASVAAATRESELWLVPQSRCRHDQGCPIGFQMVAADGAGDVWVVPEADPYTVLLLRLG